MKKATVRNAGGKGQGVFATRSIAAGETILRNDIRSKRRYSPKEIDAIVASGKLSGMDTDHWDYIGHGKYVLDFSAMSYVNHSCDPNAYCEFRTLGKQTLVAIRPIRKGDEITYDYSIQAVDCIDGRNP